MAKSRVVTRYDTLRYTLGTGCSGGSVAEQWIANAYPGVYQGILPTCSFPDAYSTATQFLDYHLLLNFFNDPTKWGAGNLWNPVTEGAVLGGPDGVMNAEVSEQAQFHVAVPTDTCAGITNAQRYDPETHPGGVRCTIQDAAINMFGPDPKALWTPAEQKAGKGFARLPIDNVGVQYGLAALQAGTITPDMFVVLNAAIGGADIDTGSTTTRVDATGSPSLARAYRTGLINETNNLDRTAIIDCLGSNPARSTTPTAPTPRGRALDREHGSHANQVIWGGPVPLLGDADCELNSFVVMDHRLRAIEKDHTSRSLPKKVITDKPTGLTDRCYNGTGQQVSEGRCPQAVVNVEGTPRTVSGDAISTDTNKCRLKPLSRADYRGVTFTDAQFSELQKTFDRGVCDFTKPGIAPQGTVAWLTYQDGRGHVVYGGAPLGKTPTSTRFEARPKQPLSRAGH